MHALLVCVCGIWYGENYIPTYHVLATVNTVNRRNIGLQGTILLGITTLLGLLTHNILHTYIVQYIGYEAIHLANQEAYILL